MWIRSRGGGRRCWCDCYLHTPHHWREYFCGVVYFSYCDNTTTSTVGSRLDKRVRARSGVRARVRARVRSRVRARVRSRVRARDGCCGLQQSFQTIR